jgi:hypothetical protein
MVLRFKRKNGLWDLAPLSVYLYHTFNIRTEIPMSKLFANLFRISTGSDILVVYFTIDKNNGNIHVTNTNTPSYYRCNINRASNKTDTILNIINEMKQISEFAKDKNGSKEKTRERYRAKRGYKVYTEYT